MILDGFIYVSIAVLGFLMTQWGSDEAGKYIGAQALFWLKTATGAGSASALALKMFRSDTYSKWRDKQNGKENENAKDTTSIGTGGTP